jgi:hypothetical protein
LAPAARHDGPDRLARAEPPAAHDRQDDEHDEQDDKNGPEHEVRRLSGGRRSPSGRWWPRRSGIVSSLLSAAHCLRTASPRGKWTNDWYLPIGRRSKRVHCPRAPRF